SDSEDAAAVEVADAVTTDTGVVPVAYEHGAIGSHADVRGPIPSVAAGHHVLAVELKRGSGRRHVVAAKSAWAGIDVQGLAPVFLGQQFAFVESHAGGRATVGPQQHGHHARLFLVPVGLAFAARVI